MSWTTRFRLLFVALFALSVIIACGGWLLCGRSPAELAPVFQWLATAIGIGEASNVGKRATFKPEAVVPERGSS
jgi:hypothetical protein